MRIICQLSILMKYLALFCYFLKSSKIWNCRQLQIIGGVFWTNSDIFILAGFQTSEVGRVIDKSCGYVCQYCCKAFQTKYQLKRHEIIHSDEKPFKCDHCDRVFKDKWASAWDFQQCGISTCVDSDEPLQPPLKLRNSKLCSVSSLTIVEYSSN